MNRNLILYTNNKKLIEFIEEHTKRDIKFSNLVLKLYTELGANLEKNPESQDFILEQRKELLNDLSNYWECQVEARKISYQLNLSDPYLQHLNYTPKTLRLANDILNYKSPFQEELEIFSKVKDILNKRDVYNS